MLQSNIGVALARAWHSFGRFTGWDEKRCGFCLEPMERGHEPSLCFNCRALLMRRTAGYCPYCGEIAAAAEAPVAMCGKCLQQKPPWRNFRFYGVFEDHLRDLLHRGKYLADMAGLEILGQLLRQVCADLPVPDAIVAMPLHPARLRWRGYNQCRELAKPLAKSMGKKIRDDLLFRSLNTAPQTGLSVSERKNNLIHAFTASELAQDLHLLLIDDTATTGTSLTMASQALLRSGARQVDVAVVAHASLHSPLEH